MTALRRAIAPAAPGRVRVTRSARPVRWTGVALVVAVVAMAYLPYVADAGLVATLVNLLILMTMASAWNLLAGYAGLVSVGQQAFIGLGAYIVLVLAQHGLSPFEAIPVAAIGCALAALPISWLLFRLRGGYFAIATWVVADACQLAIGHFPELGGGTGAALPGMFDIDPVLLTAFSYWAALAVAVATLLVAYLVLRGRAGLALTAIRDDERAARSAGVRVTRTKRLVYLLSAAACGAAGALLIISQLNVQPASAFSVLWSADMIFVVIIGGIGTLEGPIIGTVVFFALQQALAQYGAWYLIVLGAVAIVVALWAPRGIWGLVADRIHLRLFPVSYWLWADGVAAPRGRSTAGPGGLRFGSRAARGAGRTAMAPDLDDVDEFDRLDDDANAAAEDG